MSSGQRPRRGYTDNLYESEDEGVTVSQAKALDCSPAGLEGVSECDGNVLYTHCSGCEDVYVSVCMSNSSA